MMSPELLDLHVLPRVSLLVVLIFFVPLLVLVAIPTVFATRSLAKWRRALSWLWLLWCLPAEGLMLMGLAFNSAATEVLVTMVAWPFIGLAIIWFPLRLKEWIWTIVPE